MELNVQGRNVKISERLQEYVESRVVKFETLGDNVTDIEVNLLKKAMAAHAQSMLKSPSLVVAPYFAQNQRAKINSLSLTMLLANFLNVYAVLVTVVKTDV